MSKGRSIFQVNPDEKTLKPLETTSFASGGFKENVDIHEWLARTPNILGEDLMVIAREHTGFTDTGRRTDLLCIDSKGNLVIVEVKRDDSTQGVYWQALMYAAAYSLYKTSDLIRVFAKYASVNDEEANQQISDYTEGRNSTVGLNQKQRIILVAGSFPSTVTTTVLWLRERGIDISCVELKLFKDRDAHYLQATQIIPLPDTEQYLVKHKNLAQEQTRIREASEPTRNDEITRWMLNISEKLKDQLKSEKHLIPTPNEYADRPSGGKFRHFRLRPNGMKYGHWLILLNETTRAKAPSEFALSVGFRALDSSMRDALGSSEKHGTELKSRIAQLAKDNGLKWDTNPGRVDIRIRTKVSTQLNDADAQKVATALANFIRTYQSRIDSEFQAVSAKLNNPDSAGTTES